MLTNLWLGLFSDEGLYISACIFTYKAQCLTQSTPLVVTLRQFLTFELFVF